MNDEILAKLYANPQYLEYLRRHPKWYQFLEQDANNFVEFEKVVKKELKITTYDKLENFKKQVDFASALMSYLGK